MGLSSADGWGALIENQGIYEANFAGTPYYTAPIIAWKESGEQVVGLILIDNEGIDLPYPVAAPNVIGFIRYVRIDKDVCFNCRSLLFNEQSE